MIHEEEESITVPTIYAWLGIEMYESVETKVRVYVDITGEFPIMVGLYQGTVPSPKIFDLVFLFNFCVLSLCCKTIFYMFFCVVNNRNNQERNISVQACLLYVYIIYTKL